MDFPVLHGAGYVGAIAITDEGVVAAGNFETAGNTKARNVVRWDGKKWNAMGSGIGTKKMATWNNGNSMAVIKNHVYVTATSLQKPGRLDLVGIWHWDGTTWKELPERAGMEQGPLVRFGDNLVAFFRDPSPGPAKAELCSWDGSAWSRLGSSFTLGRNDMPQAGGWVNCLYVRGKEILLGGFFSNINGLPVPGLAVWNVDSSSGPTRVK